MKAFIIKNNYIKGLNEKKRAQREQQPGQMRGCRVYYGNMKQVELLVCGR